MNAFLVKSPGRTANRRGGAMLIAVVAIVVLAGLTSAVLNLTVGAQKEAQASRDAMRALYNCEAGVSHALANIAIGNAGPVGAFDAPLIFGGGGYAATIVDNGDDTFDVLAVGAYGGEFRAVEVVARTAQDGPFANALFAGNEDGDPNYTMNFGGLGGQADEIHGGVYSGRDIDVAGDAAIHGPVRANGVISGTAGDEGASQSIPDVAGMDYANNNDVDVLQEFLDHSSWKSDSFGGSAYQVDESNPAHIFRVNPSDRSAETASTSKHDFFLEDPYESVKTDVNEDGSNASVVSLSGMDDPGPDGNGLVYFIDGNLWVHNKNVLSFKLDQNGAADGVQVTFVVKGNVYFSDNLFYQDSDTDAVAFIAIEDPSEADSGNIYLGDPAFGTLRNMDAYLYAENNFYDNNLDALGSKKVTVNGTMSAGNQVLIDRDYLLHHSKLTVHFDERLWSGSVALPGLPDQSGSEQGVTILSWQEVPVPAGVGP